jgi:hypothetical protein
MTTEDRSYALYDQQVLDRIERSWRSLGLYALTPNGGMPRNLAHRIERTPDVLVITNTEGVILTWTVRS